MTTETAKNFLYYGDNLDVLRRHIADESVDLIYLDPPFNSNATYNVLFAERNGTRAAAQIKAFGDTWRWDQAAAEAYQETVEAGGQVSRAMQAFRQFLADSDMLAYLSMMAPRLIELRRVLKPTGSIYLHCDPTASHYLKMLMDAVFGAGSFRNEIIWHYRRWTNEQTQFQKMHDVILFYRRGKGVFNLTGIEPTASQAAVIERGWNVNKVKDKQGRVLQLLVYNQEKVDAAVAAEKLDTSHYDRIVDRTGVRLSAASDTWTDIQYLHSQALERLGYQTQKPEALLKRIIQASSNESDVVLDPFCGCGTTIAVAERLKRRWIGIDITHLAVGLMKHRLRDAFGDGITETYRTIGEPTSLPDAETLAAEDPFQFQAWALGLVGARVASSAKKGADKGIDGRLYFHDEGESGKTKQVILSVKAGNITSSHIRDLGHVVTREQAEIGVLITMREPTKAMRTEAAGAGFYKSPWREKNYPRLQILTVAELLEGRGIDMPPTRQVSRTFKKAPRTKGEPRDTDQELFEQ